MAGIPYPEKRAHDGSFISGTRTIHAFGGKRADREKEGGMRCKSRPRGTANKVPDDGPDYVDHSPMAIPLFRAGRLCDNVLRLHPPILRP